MANKAVLNFLENINNNDSAKKSAKERAMDSAAQYFSVEGFSKTNMDDVAKMAGMARSTLYRHFKDRDELILAVVEREAIQMGFDIQQQVKDIQDFGDFIVEGMLLAGEAIQKNSVLNKMFNPDSVAISNRLVLVTNKLTNIGIDVLNPMIAPAQKAGVLKEDLSTELVMDWVLRIQISLLTIPSEITKTKKQKRVFLQKMLLPALLN